MITIGDIINFLDRKDLFINFSDEILNMPLTRPAAISDAQPGEIAFCGATVKDPRKVLSQTHASLLIMDKNISVDKDTLSYSGFQAIILSDNARLDFIKIIKHFFTPAAPAGIHPSAVIASSAVIGVNTYLGPHCTIGDNVEIGEGTVVYAGVYIYDNVNIGRNVIINSGTVIGASGFGFELDEDGKWEKFPHIGGVQIFDDVEIGSNVSIDRGTLVNTVLERGCKINNLAHIAHNVQLGKNSIIMANVYLGGSVKVGERCWISPHSVLRDRIQIGSNVFIGMGSVVTKDIPGNMTVMGSPAREVSEQKRLLKYWAAVIKKTKDSGKNAK